jgi:hypothetical protein
MLINQLTKKLIDQLLTNPFTTQFFSRDRARGSDPGAMVAHYLQSEIYNT